MISIVDYGLGNTLAFANTYKRLNIDASICTSPKQLSDANKIILPGVGSFDWAMARLNESGLRDVLDELVLKKKVPVIGICVGMQMMANRSEEGVTDGLGWIDADVKFSMFRNSLKRPISHIWAGMMLFQKKGPCSQVWSKMHASIFALLLFRTQNDEQILAQSDYGYKFTSAAHRENIYGVQFHPEKSHHWGIRLLKNFAELC